MLKTHKYHFTSVQSQPSHELQEPSALTIVRVERSTTSSPRMTAIRAFRPGLTLALCLLSNVFAGMLATLMAAYLPDTVRDLTGMVDPGTVGRVGSYVGSLFLAGAPWASGGSRTASGALTRSPRPWCSSRQPNSRRAGATPGPCWSFAGWSPASASAAPWW